MMKIMKSVSDLYDEQHPLMIRLQAQVDEVFNTNKHRTWHYISRVKERESFALKLETGRASPEKLEDFFACTLVVENASKIAEARALIDQFFELEYKRPKQDGFTHKSPDAFPFDDIRLYVRFKELDDKADSPVRNILFEIQVKTFLQHAWSIATHDLIYKTDAISWSRERVAYQVKAILEQAEVVISSAEHLATKPELHKTSRDFDNLRNILNFINNTFNQDDLPSNTLLLAKNINELLKNLKISLAELKRIIKEESISGNGVITRNLSPYAILVQALINQSSARLREYLRGEISGEFKIFLPQELSLTSIGIIAADRAVVLQQLQPGIVLSG